VCQLLWGERKGADFVIAALGGGGARSPGVKEEGERKGGERTCLEGRGKKDPQQQRVKKKGMERSGEKGKRKKKIWRTGKSHEGENGVEGGREKKEIDVDRSGRGGGTLSR